MKRCHHCKGKFGLVRYTYGFKQFCRRSCLEAHKLFLQQEVRKRKWVAWLYGYP